MQHAAHYVRFIVRTLAAASAVGDDPLAAAAASSAASSSSAAMTFRSRSRSERTGLSLLEPVPAATPWRTALHRNQALHYRLLLMTWGKGKDSNKCRRNSIAVPIAHEAPRSSHH